MYRSFRFPTAIGLAFITFLAVVIVPAASAFQGDACVALSSTGGPVNLRTAPGDWAGADNAIGGDAGATVLARTDNGWLQVQMDVSGMMFSGFIPEAQVTLYGSCGGLPVIPASNYDPTPVMNALPSNTSADDVQFPPDFCTVTAAGRDAVIFTAPEANSAGIGILSPGPWLTATAWDGGAWYLVTMFDGGQGWVEYGTITLHGPCDSLPILGVPREPTATLIPTLIAPTVVPPDFETAIPSELCTLSSANGTQVYQRADANATVIKSIPGGIVYTVFTRSGEWVEIFVDGGLGWVQVSAVTLVGNCEMLPEPTATLPFDPALYTTSLPPVDTATPIPSELPPTVVPPMATPTLIPAGGAGLCMVTTAGSEPVITRVGPGDEYAPYDQLLPGAAYLGVILSDNQWVEISTVTRGSRLIGWVYQREVILSDVCMLLPLVAAADYNVDAWYPQP